MRCIDHHGVVAEQEGEFAERCGGQPQRLREQPRHPRVDDSFVDVHVDHLVDERWKPAHRSEFKILDELVLTDIEAFGELGHGGLAAFHHPWEDHEEAAQSLGHLARTAPPDAPLARRIASVRTRGGRRAST